MDRFGCRQFRRARALSRRDVLRAGSLSLLGLSLPELLARRAAAADAEERSFGRAKACILLFMWGGPAHEDTWDMKPNAPPEIRGEFQPIATNVPGLSICEHMPRLARRCDKLTIVRSMTHGNADHTPSTHFLLTGQPPPPGGERRAQWPSMGSVLSKLGRGRGPLPSYISFRPKLENDVPRFVEESQGQWGGWMGPMHDPLIIDDDPSRADYRVADLALSEGLSKERLDERRYLLAQVESLAPAGDAALAAHAKNLQRAYDLLTSAADAKGAFDLTQEPQAMRERYGLNPHGQSVLQARRLIERGVPLVTVFWPSEGIKNISVYWDTHSRNFIDLKDRLMPVADQAFSALLDDLSELGMLDETLVVWTGEFGRTPRIGQRNSDAGAGRDGRDHWPNCFTSVLAGGGVRGGYVHGKSDKHAAYPAADPVLPADLIATVYHLLGVAEHQTLPDLNGRPVFVRPGKAIEELLG
ncbi:MAG: DUF1501 domain-containing protein [Planctomycetaceae bacterium]|nr:DUF1501 domain-containing protein [Planctomycetaceae bacterium]